MAAAEAVRLEEDARRAAQLEALGPVPLRAAVGHGARGLLRRRRRAGTTSRTTTRAAAPIAGARTGCSASCDRECRLCFALALWNGRDPILKERLFGLTGPEGNHGEDVKECYYYLDSTPTHSYMKALYKYPQAEFPYARLVEENRRRGTREPRVRARRHRRVRRATATSTSSPSTPRPSPDDILIRITVANRGPEAATLHLLPTLWFRNTWSLGPHAARATGRKPQLSSARPRRRAAPSTRRSARFRLARGAGPYGTRPSCCSPRTRPTPSGCSASPNATPYVKDAFHEYVVARHARRGEPGARRHQGRGALPARGPGRRARSSCGCGSSPSDEAPADAVRRASSTRIFDDAHRARPTRSTPRVAPAAATRRRARASRARRTRACCGASSSTTTSCEDWLEGDPAQPPPPPQRRARAATPTGRTSTTATSSRCRTSGSTRGTRRGTWRST